MPGLAPETPPPDAPQPSDEALRSLEDKFTEFQQSPPTQDFTLTLTESEVTSLVNAELNNLDLPQGISIGRAVVLLRDGEIQTYTDLNVSGIDASGVLAAVPNAQADGRVDIEVTRAEFGIVDLSPQVIEQVTQTVEDGLNNTLANVRVTSIAVQGGQMTISGQPQ
ncbi:MAG: hypothetical protein GYB64_05695 [Chloroflexi bacterium]|nr:hypothetical protein [Chloroflexota bacterium]